MAFARHENQKRCKVIKIDSKQTWDILMYHAKNQARPIVAHFTASWCIPSVAMTPVLAELALSYHQNILFMSVDVDEVKEVAAEMEIKAMPTFMFMRDGVKVDKLVGANPEEIKKRIASFISSTN